MSASAAPAPPAATPSLAWGYLPSSPRPLPPHPSQNQVHQGTLTSAQWPTSPLLVPCSITSSRSIDPAAAATRLASRSPRSARSGPIAPLRCPECLDTLITAYSESTPAAYTFLTACRHAPGAEDPGSHDSDDDDPEIAVEDRDPDVVPNGATLRVVEDVGYHRIRGNFLVVKHSVVAPLPQRLMDAELYDVDTEDFALIHGLVRRFLAGNSRDHCADFLPSPYVFHNIRG
ncbi:hypothetical protein C8F01DRAFT_1249529 [Mycena amicta]|nr:hypothetical protein C8F01DRAFT_1249529 [Mycena amicta]